MWTHQQDAIEWAKDRRESLLWLGMGCGKTRVAISLILLWRSRRVLVCCPKAVVPAWKKQATLWAPELRVLLLESGDSKKKEKLLVEAFADDSPLVVVVNYESAWRIPLIEKTPWDCLVYDEIHRLKSASGVASRWAARMGKKNPAARRVGLSGTMLSQTPVDAFGVWRAVESPECQTFGTSKTAFVHEYTIRANPYVPQQITGYRNMNTFGTKVAQTTFHRKSSDVLDLPPIMHEQIDVDLNTSEARVYREVEREFCAVLNGKDVAPKNVLEQLLRLLEICGGSVHREGERDASPLSERSSKATVVGEILEDLPKDEPVVVFCKFRADIESILREVEKSGRLASELSGRRNQLAEWQDGKTSVLVANTASGGIGVDLTRASYGIFYSLGHSLSEYLQAIARLHRPGQSRSTHFYSLVATIGGRVTVDGHVYKALESRQEVLDAIITGYGSTQRVGVGA